jgi:hypothetical protein
VAVYLLTSSEDPEHKKQATADGVTEYILKAPLIDTLIQKLDEFIANCDRRKTGPVRGGPDTSSKPAMLGLPHSSLDQRAQAMG